MIFHDVIIGEFFIYLGSDFIKTTSIGGIGYGVNLATGDLTEISDIEEVFVYDKDSYCDIKRLPF